jgi:hypothetical protein
VEADQIARTGHMKPTEGAIVHSTRRPGSASV